MNPFLGPRYTQFIATTTMLGKAFLWSALVLAAALQNRSRFGLGNFAAYAQSTSTQADFKASCEKIARSISSASQVFYSGELRVIGLPFASFIQSGVLDSQEFNLDISHWANSSSQAPACTVEPGTPGDVGLIVNFTLPPILSRYLVDVFYAHSFSKLPQIACRLQ